ncbi:MAG: hypothetical protein Q8Q40_07580 [Methylococcaceae bacterium]|nr:hypothetical protein [Methylococcaceae bacterium]MDP3903822.1 hypothetical protein [Methylococcaceae bacterium]
MAMFICLLYWVMSLMRLNARQMLISLQAWYNAEKPLGNQGFIMDFLPLSEY